MHDESLRTLADVIRDYSDCVVAGDRLSARLVENDRKMAGYYQSIRDALSRPGMADVAVLDESTETVYAMTAAGVVGRFHVMPSDLVGATDVATDACDAISVGEAS